jgi:hypothetical protein
MQIEIFSKKEEEALVQLFKDNMLNGFYEIIVSRTLEHIKYTVPKQEATTFLIAIFADNNIIKAALQKLTEEQKSDFNENFDTNIIYTARIIFFVLMMIDIKKIDNNKF